MAKRLPGNSKSYHVVKRSYSHVVLCNNQHHYIRNYTTGALWNEGPCECTGKRQLGFKFHYEVKQ